MLVTDAVLKLCQLDPFCPLWAHTLRGPLTLWDVASPPVSHAHSGLASSSFYTGSPAHTTLNYLCLLFFDLEFPQPNPDPNMHQVHPFPLFKLLCKSKVFPVKIVTLSPTGE